MIGSTTQRRRKHSKSRTGCFTCKRRRTKCDEQKPICGGCLKGSRECIYPPSVQTIDKSSVGKTLGAVTETIENRQRDVDDRTQKGIEKFSARGQSAIPSSLDLFQSDQQMLIGYRRAPVNITESFYKPPISMFPLSISTVPPSYFYEGLAQSSTSTPPTQAIQIPTIPRSFRDRFIQFFLRFHQENVTEFHYFCYHDYHKFLTRTLLAMVQHPGALRDAVVAFSALIYSMKVDRSARVVAFLYYTSALQQLRLVLDQVTLSVDECHMAIATALQLATFDVFTVLIKRFLIDSVKCFRHLQGAACIMLKFSNPVLQCSSVVGRFLLGWYCICEDYLCLRAAYGMLLPAEWRHENLRIRQKLAVAEYSYLPQKDRKPRLLDDLWVELWSLLPCLLDILATVPQLKTMNCRRRTEMAVHLESKFQQFYRDLLDFINSPAVIEILQPLPSLSMTTSKHAHCCPPPPFIPHFFQYPPAGLFHLLIQCLITLMRFTLYPSLRAELEFELKVAGLQDRDITSYSLELCRTFAGIESQFDHNSGVIFPCFVPMVMAAVSCSPNVRPWMFAKLRHFEEKGRFCGDNVKKRLSVLWNMPEIATQGFGVSPPGNPSVAAGEVVDITAGMGKVNLNHEEENVEDDGLEALTQIRGVFGLQDKGN